MTINPSESEAERIKKTFLENPWSNAYWFARMFMFQFLIGNLVTSEGLCTLPVIAGFNSL